MKRIAIYLTAAAAFLGFAASAQADLITAGSFPASGDLYHSATNGDGALPAGGKTAYMWTAGDYVMPADAEVTGSALATSVTDIFTISNHLGATNLKIDGFLNGIDIGTFTVLACGFCGSDQIVNFSASFAPILLSGPFTFQYILQNTIADGDGSIAFEDGGEAAIFGTLVGVPEPLTLSLFGAGLVGAAAMRRKRKTA